MVSAVAARRDIGTGRYWRGFRTTLRKMVAEYDGESSRAACHFIMSRRAFDEFPALVTAAIDPQHPGGDAMASTVLDLARALHEEIVAYRRAPAGRDPSFARRWALTALAKAVDRFREHRRMELIEAFLLITTPGNHTLIQLLNDQSHPVHEPLLSMLRTSPSLGAIDVLAKIYDDPQAPLALLELAAQRTDAHFRNLFLQSIGNPPSPRTLENVQRVKRLQLLEKPEGDWFEAVARPASSSRAADRGLAVFATDEDRHYRCVSPAWAPRRTNGGRRGIGGH